MTTTKTGISYSVTVDNDTFAMSSRTVAIRAAEANPTGGVVTGSDGSSLSVASKAQRVVRYQSSGNFDDGGVVARVRTYADRRGLSQDDAVEQILRDHLDTLERRAAGAAATNAGRSKVEHAAASRRGAAVRWARAR